MRLFIRRRCRDMSRARTASIVRVPIVLVVALCAAATTSLAKTEPILRGFDPTEAAALRDATTFTCDGTRTIAIMSVNDDYCDCEDGSDEPGTSACAGVGAATSMKGMHCVNFGSTSTVVPSSRVNDGICDCCDGSDEYDSAQNGGVVCENTCTAAAKARRAVLANALSTAKRGIKAKLKARGESNGKRVAWEQQAKTLQKEIDGAKNALESLRALKEQEETLEREAQEKARLAAEEKQADMTQSTENDDVGDAQNANSEAERDMDEVVEETAEERGKRIAGQWISDESESTRGGENVVVDDPVPVEEAQPSKFSALIARAKRALNLARGAKDAVDAGGTLTTARTHRDAFDKKQRAIDALLSQIEDIRANIDRYYGPDDAMIRLHGQCYEAKIEKYTYKACPFGEAHQDGVLLGASTGGVELSTATGEMMLKFTSGAKCWNGPDRSLSLTLKCGDRETLANVEEPSRCEYAATLFTPQACEEFTVSQLDDELSALDRIIAGVPRDEL